MGGQLDDVLEGDDQANLLDGEGGNDTLRGMPARHPHRLGGFDYAATTILQPG